MSQIPRFWLYPRSTVIHDRVAAELSAVPACCGGSSAPPVAPVLPAPGIMVLMDLSIDHTLWKLSCLHFSTNRIPQLFNSQNEPHTWRPPCSPAAPRNGPAFRTRPGSLPNVLRLGSFGRRHSSTRGIPCVGYDQSSRRCKTPPSSRRQSMRLIHMCFL